MAKRYHNTLLNRLIALLMALHVINASIDVRDRYATTLCHCVQHEDLSVNEIESFGELLLEEGLGLTNAVPEREESDDDSEVTSFEEDFYFHQQFVFAVLPTTYWYLTTQSLFFKPAHILTHVPEITSPPPQRVA